MEHHSNIVPWQLACQATGAELRYLEVGDDGTLSLDQLDRELARGDVALVAVTHVSNVLGTINPVAEIVARAHAAGALALIDGAQAVPQMPRRPDRDRRRLLRLDRAQGARPDRRRRAPRARRAARGDAALPRRRRHDPDRRGPALDLERAAVEVRGRHLDDRPGRSGSAPRSTTSTRVGMATCAQHEQALTALRARAPRASSRASTLFGPPSAAERGGVVSFAVDGVHPHDVGELLGRAQRLRSREPPLRAAADAAARRRRHRAGELRSLQRGGRRRRAGRRDPRRPGGVRAG